MAALRAMDRETAESRAPRAQTALVIRPALDPCGGRRPPATQQLLCGPLLHCALCDWFGGAALVLLIVAACSAVSRPSRLRRCVHRNARSLDTTCARCARNRALARGRHFEEEIMTLRIYPIVLQLVRRLSPYLPALRARSTSLGDQLERALISIPLAGFRRPWWHDGPKPPRRCARYQRPRV